MPLTEGEAKLLEFRYNVATAKLEQIKSLIPEVSVIPLDKAFSTLREIRKIIDERQ